MGLSLTDEIFVDIKKYGWIEEIRRQGPQPRILLPVSTILELLNQGIQTVIPAKWMPEVYSLLKAYNETAKILGEKTADKAEAFFQDKFDRDAAEIERKIPNPFAQSPIRTEIKRSTGIEIPDSLKKQGFATVKSVANIKSKAMHEMLLPRVNTAVIPTQTTDLDEVVFSQD